MINSFRVKKDTTEYHAMLVCFNKGKSYCFKECGNGLYYLEIYDPEIVPLTAKDTGTDYSCYIL